MSIVVGNGIWLKGFFANGSECTYPRPFFVIEVTRSTVKALNISSIKGKEDKLRLSSNKKLPIYFPPFHAPSFVKLDELYEFEHCLELYNVIMCQGKPATNMIVTAVSKWFAEYKSKRRVHTVSISRDDFLIRNNPYPTVPKILH